MEISLRMKIPLLSFVFWFDISHSIDGCYTHLLRDDATRILVRLHSLLIFVSLFFCASLNPLFVFFFFSSYISLHERCFYHHNSAPKTVRGNCISWQFLCHLPMKLGSYIQITKVRTYYFI